MKQRIGVFLSSKEALPEAYHRAAQAVGAWLGRTGRTLVYGGSRSGLMEELAQSCAGAGGKVIGVVPQVVASRNLVSEACHTVFYTADLSDRKSTMMRESDLCVALPGGVGTLDEVFTVLAADVIGTESGAKRCPVVLFDVDGCWDGLLRLLDDLEARGLITWAPGVRPVVVSDVDALEQLCQ